MNFGPSAGPPGHSRSTYVSSTRPAGCFPPATAISLSTAEKPGGSPHEPNPHDTCHFPSRRHCLALGVSPFFFCPTSVGPFVTRERHTIVRGFSRSRGSFHCLSRRVHVRRPRARRFSRTALAPSFLTHRVRCTDCASTSRLSG